MTLALLAIGLAVALWPQTDPEAARVAQLQADQRLAPSIGATFAWRWPSWRTPSARVISPMWLPIFVGGAVVTAALPAVGPWAAAEFGACALVLVFGALAVIRQLVRGRRELTRQSQTGLVAALAAAELDVGSAPAVALTAAAQLNAVGVELERDLVGRGALANLDLGDPLARIVHAWRMSARTGTPLVEVLARVRHDLVDAGSARRAIASAVAGPQASAGLLAMLPALGVGLGSALGADPVGILIGTGAGRVLLLLGILLDVAGVLWTVRLISSAQR